MFVYICYQLLSEQRTERLNIIAETSTAVEEQWDGTFIDIHYRISEDVLCLGEAIYFESRGESKRGQALVAQTILNRVEHKWWPSTVCQVVSEGSYITKSPEKCQFSYTCDGVDWKIKNMVAWDKAVQIAIKALEGEYKSYTKANIYVRCGIKRRWLDNPNKVKYLGKEGRHCFYQEYRR